MLTCCCSLAGTNACLSCPRYLQYNNLNWQYPIKQIPTAQWGWVCPKCDKINAPFVVSCDCNNKQDQSVIYVSNICKSCVNYDGESDMCTTHGGCIEDI